MGRSQVRGGLGASAALTADEPLVMVHYELPTLLPDRFARALHFAVGRTTVTWPFTIGFRSPGVPQVSGSAAQVIGFIRV
jgi:hypothetical protein